MPDPIRVVLVEDNQVFREALELLLGLQSDITVVATVGDGSSAPEVVEEHRPDVVLMDFRLPGIDGLQTTRAVLDAAPGVAGAPSGCGSQTTGARTPPRASRNTGTRGTPRP